MPPPPPRFFARDISEKGRDQLIILTTYRGVRQPIYAPKILTNTRTGVKLCP